MITKNFKTLMSTFFGGCFKNFNGSILSNESNLTVKTTANADVNVFSLYQAFPYIGGVFITTNSFANPAYLNGGVVIFGKGTTQPTENDITLTTPFAPSNASLSGVSASLTGAKAYVNSNGNSCIDVYYRIINGSSESITISEIGLFMQGPISGTANEKHSVMLDHTLLDEPVTIAANSSDNIVYTFIGDWTDR